MTPVEQARAELWGCLGGLSQNGLTAVRVDALIAAAREEGVRGAVNDLLGYLNPRDKDRVVSRILAALERKGEG
jgi:hypothetical protein